MIKLSRGLYIHILTLVFFAVCFAFDNVFGFLITYAIMLVHELAHLAAAVLIGLKPWGIVLYPFGVNLRLKNKMVYGIADEIILYAAGPAANLGMALLAVTVFSGYEYSADFYLRNMALFALNMLPVAPLDGGIILKKLIMRRLGFERTERAMTAVSCVIIVCLSAAAVYAAVKNSFNLSVCIFIAFLLGNILVSKEKYNTDFIKELIYYKERGKEYKKRGVRILAAEKNGNMRELIKRFTCDRYHIVFFLDEKNEIDDILTETQIIRGILTK